MAEGPRKTSAKAWQNQAGGAPTPGQSKGPGWKQADAPKPGRGSRMIKILGLLFGIGAVVGGIIFLILYLMEPPKPVFVVIGANPAKDADKLNVPIDPFGWQSARLFLDRTQKASIKSRFVVGEDGGPGELPTTEDGLNNWAKDFPGREKDPLVLYLALHGGTDEKGPILFTGGVEADGRPKRTAVKDLILALTNSNNVPAPRTKVLILDTGRLAPDPIYGQLHDDFVARMKKDINPLILACPNLVVILGTDADQRGHESEEHQSTAFAQFVIHGLHGEAATPSSDLIMASDLFKHIRDKTSDWADRNRNKPQTPILLPDGPAGLERASSLKVVRKPDGGTPSAPDAKKFSDATAIASLDKLWADHDELAKRSPAPGSYTPRAWRRYRELLLRYEWAARAGEGPTCAFLATKLGGLKAIIDGGPLQVEKFESVKNSIGFWIAATGGMAPLPPEGTRLGADLSKDPLPSSAQAHLGFTEGILDVLVGSGPTSPGDFPLRLKQSAALFGKEPFPSNARTPEAHLPVMVQHFYQTVLAKPSDPPAGWLQAFDVKRRAERAAVGLPAGKLPLVEPTAMSGAGSNANPYAERLWPLFEKDLLDADADRREGEDRLFGTAEAEFAAAGEKLKSAAKKYEGIAESARIVRTALLVRDRAFADLPFLTRWVAGVGPASPHAAGLPQLWADAHKLDKLLDEPRKPDGAKAADAAILELAKSVASRFDALNRAIKSVANDAAKPGSLQDPWATIQLLLPAATIDRETRMTLLKSSWDISFALETKGDRQPPVPQNADALQAQLRAAAGLRGRLARAMLGTELLDAEIAERLPGAQEIDSELRKLETISAVDAEGWSKIAQTTGTSLSAHYKKLGEPPPPATKEPNAIAERASRVAVAIDTDGGFEPAAANHRLRWRDLLVGLATRTVLDHWYDEAPSPRPYFKDAATRYLNDAATKVAEKFPEAAYAPPPNSLLAPAGATGTYPTLSADPLDAVDWTSDRERTFDLAVVAPPAFPVSGLAAAFTELTGGNVLKPLAPAERRVLPLQPGGRVTIPNRVGVVDENGEQSNPNCAASAAAYFRGQRPRQDQPIRVSRRPDLVITNPLPEMAEFPVSVALEASDDLKLGTVVVLIDLSGSMQADLNDKLIGREDTEDWRKGDSKFKLALAALKELLRSLPYETPLRIRVFADDVKRDESRVVYPDPALGDEPKVVWREGNMKFLDALMDRLWDLKPAGLTPLVTSIKEAVEQDFRPKGAAGTKTLIVLTDGIEQKIAAVPNAGDMRDARDRLTDLFKQEAFRPISLQVVQLGLGKLAPLAKIMFGEVKELNKQGCNVWTMAETEPGKGRDLLTANLLDAIWPKVHFRKADGNLLDKFPPIGWPSRPKPKLRAGLNWSNKFPPDSYTAESLPLRDGADAPFSTSPGDRVILRFEPDQPGGSGLRIRRTLYADYIKSLTGTAVTERPSDKKWVFSAYENWVDAQQLPARYGAFASLELKADTILKPKNPEVLWWDVKPIQPKSGVPERNPDGGPERTVRVRQLYAYPAPSWRIDVGNWPRAEGAAYTGAEIRAWIAGTGTNELFQADDTLDVRFQTQPDREANVKGDKLKVRYAFGDTYDFGAGPVADCLIVRVSHPPNKPVQARLTGSMNPSNAEHRYYKMELPSKDRAFAEYTAVFGPIDSGDLENDRLKVQFMAVDPTPPPAQVMVLTPPAPRDANPTYQSYRPPDRK